MNKKDYDQLKKAKEMAERTVLEETRDLVKRTRVMTEKLTAGALKSLEDQLRKSKTVISITIYPEHVDDFGCFRLNPSAGPAVRNAIEQQLRADGFEFRFQNYINPVTFVEALDFFLED